MVIVTKVSVRVARRGEGRWEGRWEAIVEITAGPWDGRRVVRRVEREDARVALVEAGGFAPIEERVVWRVEISESWARGIGGGAVPCVALVGGVTEGCEVGGGDNWLGMPRDASH